jgi:hypothetical protein
MCRKEVEIIEPHPMLRPRPPNRLDTHGEDMTIGCSDSVARIVFVGCIASGADVHEAV